VENTIKKQAIILSITFLLTLLSCGAVSAANYTVGPGSAYNYHNISSAVAAAKDGYNITVYPNTNGTPYNENIVINNKLNLTAYGKVIVQPTGNSDAFKINSKGNGTIIYGFTIISNGLNGTGGIFLNGTKNCTIVKNNITTTDGINILDGSNNLINENIIKSGTNSTGIMIEDNNTISSHNTITQNNITSLMGIVVGGSNNTVSLNTITSDVNSTMKSIGIMLANVAPTISPTNNNTVSKNNMTGMYMGIAVSGSNNTISGNTINPEDTSDLLTGIFIGFSNVLSSNNTITQNTINTGANSTGNPMGIMLINSVSNIVSKNMITITSTNGSTMGMAIQYSQKNTIYGNIITSNSGPYSAGIMLLNSTQNTISSNNINSGVMGILVGNSTNTIINYNRIIASHAIINEDTGLLNALYNWYGTNSNPSNKIIGNVNYAPWLVLTITSNQNSILNGFNSTITADLKHDSNGVIHNTTYITDGLIINFTNVILGAVNPTSGKTVNGIVNTTFTAGNIPGTANISAKLDNQTVTTNIKIGLTISQLITAAQTIKSYYETNHVLPSNVTIYNQTITMPMLLQYLVMGTININAGNLTLLNSATVKPPLNESGNFNAGNIQEPEYLSIAQNIKSYIKTNGIAPNYEKTSLGNIPFTKLVYMYSKIINYYGVNNRLPNYVSMTP
jgi:parallel beta-helix repeat protein